MINAYYIGKNWVFGYTPTEGDIWILETNFWDDDAIWIDTETWND